jgi:hypothetical protein
MTLVVAKIIGDHIRIESDSKLTFESEKQYNNPYLYGTLKTITVSNDINISFAGLVEIGNINYPSLAFTQIYDLKNKKDSLSVKDVVRILMKIHKMAKGEIDFIISYFGKKPELIKIQNRDVYKGENTYWIGDCSGFNIFQSAYVKFSENIKLTAVEQSKLMINAFSSVIQERAIVSVSGLQVGVTTSSGYFKYMVRGDIDSQKKVSLKQNEEKIMPLGDASDGSFGVSYLVSEDRDKAGIGIHFFHGKMGVFYPTHFSVKKQFKKNVDGYEFVKWAEDKFGVSLAGFIIDLDNNNIKYVGKKSRKFGFSINNKGSGSDVKFKMNSLK